MDIGKRMKENYEDRTRFYLPRRTYGIIRLDGKAFHSYTRKLDKPFSSIFCEAMNQTALKLQAEVQGSILAYTQSDEISIILQDFKNINTSAWFDYNIQKLASVSASIATYQFNKEMAKSYPNIGEAFFDSRVFSIPDPHEVINYLIWRNQDCIRNSIQSLGQAHFSPKQLHKKSCKDIKEILKEKGINWEELEYKHKYGFLVTNVSSGSGFDFLDKTHPHYQHIRDLITQVRED